MGNSNCPPKKSTISNTSNAKPSSTSEGTVNDGGLLNANAGNDSLLPSPLSMKSNNLAASTRQAQAKTTQVSVAPEMQSVKGDSGSIGFAFQVSNQLHGEGEGERERGPENLSPQVVYASPPPPQWASAGSSASSDPVEQQILDLIDMTGFTSSDSKLLLSQLPSLYFSTYGSKIPFKERGHSKLVSFLDTIPTLSVVDSGGQFYVSQRKPEAERSTLPTRQAEKESVSSPSGFDLKSECESVHSIPASLTLENKQSRAADDDPSYMSQTNSVSGSSDPAATANSTPMPLSEIKEAASNLSPKMRRKILALLAQYPDGITANQIKKNVSGLVFYLQACAQTTGRQFISPATFLSHCEGISAKYVAGRKLFFLSGKMPSEEPPGYGGNYTTDGAAAVELVKLLDKAYHNRPWPGTKKQLKRYLTSVDTQTSPAIMMWLEKGLDRDIISDAKRNKEIIKRAMYQLKRLGCVGGTNHALVWNQQAIRAITDTEVSVKTTWPVPVDALESRMGISPTQLIDTIEKLQTVKLVFPFNPLAEPAFEEDYVVAIDCEGVPDSIFLIQVGTCIATYVFDCVKLGAKEICEFLRPLLTGPHVTKLFHDLHNDAVAFYRIGGITYLSNTLDTQLAIEAVTGDLHIGLNQMLQQLGQDRHPLKQSMKLKMDDGRLFAQRPLPQDVLEYAVLDVSLLLKAKESLFAVLGATRYKIQRASDTRAKLAPESGGLRQICFDVANSYSLSSLELMQELRPNDMLGPVPLEVSDDTDVLLAMLPEDLCQNLKGQTQLLSDVVLDKGREPLAWIKGERVHLGTKNRTVSKEDIDGIVERLGGFGGDNRAGLEKQLHRVSAMRNRQQDIIGLTLRVGRHVSGNAAMISDLMFGDCSQSILFLGEPGSGKTTVVREVTKQLAERFNVCIVDTSNEIAGDGDIPHPCVGYARRMMVPSLEKQSSVMVECVQNHTPEVMVIDEIGRPTEVEAARTCKQRGVRLIASAHGDLRKLIKNPKLRGLIGGIETVTLGDAQAKEEAKRSGNAALGLQKVKAQRAGPPAFDIIVELRRGAPHEWRIVMDVGEAVDKVLEGQNYKAQRRTRLPQTGALTLELEMA